MLTEDYANEDGEQRWALTPSVLQHIGTKSSKNSRDNGEDTINTIWNFAFERNEAKALRKEHELAVIELFGGVS